MGGNAEAGDARARAAGRGGIAVLAAKAFFIVIGLVQQTVLPRVIGLAGYGALSRVLAVASVVNNVVVASSIQGVSRTVARAPGREHEALRATLRVHLPLALGLAACFAAAAPLVARFEQAPHVAAPLAAAAGVVALYGVYSPLVGMLNGQGQFTRQAGLDVTFAVLRTIGLLGVGWLFFHRGLSGALGATVGFVGAAACIVPLAARRAGLARALRGPASLTPARRASPGASEYLSQLVPLALAQLGTNVLMQVDITILGRFLSQGALATVGADGAAKAADEWVAVYRACQLFAFLPYQLLFSVTQVLFPMVARAKAEGDDDAVTRYVGRGARIAAIACGLMVSVIVAAPGSLLHFAYGAEVASRGADTLRVLAVGQGAFAMLGIATTVLASLGRERVAAAITACACVAVALACFATLSGASFGGAQIDTAARATTGALGAAFVAGAIAVFSTTRTFVPLATVTRVGVAVAAAYLGGTHLPTVGRLATIALAGLLALAYVAFLAASGEFGRDDLANVRALVAKRQARATG